MAEDELIRRVVEHNLSFGFGNYVWHGGLSRWTDGNWLHVLWMGGLVGLTVQLTALHVLPSVLALARPRGRPDARQAASPVWGLAAWCILLMIDDMHNGNYFTPTALVAGALVGSYLSRDAGGFQAGPIVGDRPRSSLPIPLVVTVILLVFIEVLGRSQRTAPPSPDPPAPKVEPRNSQP
jgi:hypothetical protein